MDGIEDILKKSKERYESSKVCRTTQVVYNELRRYETMKAGFSIAGDGGMMLISLSSLYVIAHVANSKLWNFWK